MSELLSPSISVKPSQTTLLAPQLRQGLKLLAMGLPELRAELRHAVAENPVLEDERDAVGDASDDALEGPDETEEIPDGSEDAVDDLGVAYLEGVNRGMVVAGDSDRRERFFNSQISKESLEEHLLRQAKVSDISESDYPLVETLIGELDGDGYFRGNLRMIAEVSGEREQKLRALLRKISTLDPPGCGATSLRECLEPQLDAIRDDVLRHRVAAVLPHLTDIAFMRRVDAEVLAALRTLEPHPGRNFRQARNVLDYVRPEVKAVPDGRGGWSIHVDTRGLPTFRISKRCMDILENPQTDEKTRAYLRERLASARALMDAIDRRQKTIERIVEAILLAQPEFLHSGMSALRPLTMQEIGERVGVHHTTVSRTVHGKYVSTPRGTFELRQFFSTSVATETGESASLATVLTHLKELVGGEDLGHPLSDAVLSRKLKERGFDVARRTVAKYRLRLGIPSASRRAVK